MCASKTLLSGTRRRARAHRKRAAAPFHVVAFSDTDDLLTWGPADAVREDPSVYLLMDFTNVFVQNSPRWLGVIENPADAHSGYFTNDNRPTRDRVRRGR